MAYVFKPTSATLSLRTKYTGTEEDDYTTHTVSNINPEITDTVAEALGGYITACRDGATLSATYLNLIENVEEE